MLKAWRKCPETGAAIVCTAAAADIAPLNKASADRENKETGHTFPHVVLSFLPEIHSSYNGRIC